MQRTLPFFCSSFVLLAWSALFAENTTDHGGRVRAVKYTQIATLIAVNVVIVMEKVSDSLQVVAVVYR